ncbi:MAG: chromosome partition protein MukE [Candidatus Symbiodolus clandestinus]
MSSITTENPPVEPWWPMIGHPQFPALDSALRSGRHISQELVDWYPLLLDHQEALSQFYGRYQVELIRAPEGFFYLRPKASTLIARALLSEWEMLVGKLLCYLYLSPERLNQQGLFTLTDLYQTLFTLVDQQKLLGWVNARASGSDRDRHKIMEKVKIALNRLKRIGVVVMAKEGDYFRITEVAFRFAADVRSGEDPQQAQQRLIRQGEAVIPPAFSGYGAAETTDRPDEHEVAHVEEREWLIEGQPC